MAEASGWGVIPLSLSLSGINKEIGKNLTEPTRKAALEAGKSIEKNIGDGAAAAQKAVDKANYRSIKSTAELEAAEAKVAEAKDKTVQAARAVESAEIARAQAVSKANAGLESAERDYQKVLASGAATADEVAAAERKVEDARQSSAKVALDQANKVDKALAGQRKSARDVETAQAGVEKALTESANAADSLAKRQKELEDAQGKTEKSAQGLGKRFKQMGTDAKDAGGEMLGLSGGLKDVAGKAGLIGAAIGGVASLGEFASMGKEVAGSIGEMNREMGLTGPVADQMGDEVGQLLRSGVVSGAEEAAGAVGAMKAQFKDMPIDEIDGLADNLTGFAKTFEMDISEATQTAGQLITNGLAPDVESAADLMTAAMQQVPQAMRGEVQDAITEYGVNFANLGYSGEEAFSLLAKQAEGGQYAIDKTGDAIKEFSVLAIDPAKAEAFESLGLNAEESATAVAEGGDAARETLEETAQALLDMEDPGARAAKAVELFGAPIEDLGVDQIPGFLEGLTGVGDGLGDVEGKSQELSDSIANSLSGRLNAAKGFLQDLAGDGFMAVWDATQWVVDGFKTLSGPAIDGISAAFGTVKDLAGGVTDILFRGDYTGLPFGLSEDSGVVDFLFNIRESVIDTRDTLTAAWDEITSAFSGGDWGTGALSELIGAERAEELVDMLSEYGERLRDFWDQISSAVSDAWDAIQPVFDWLVGFLKDQMGGVLESLGGSLGSIASAFGAVASAVGGALWEALQGAWELFKSLWDLLSPFILPILKTIGAVVGGVVVGAFMGLVGAVRLAAEVIEVVATVIQWLAENVLSPLIGLVGDVARVFYEVLAAAFDAVRGDFETVTNFLVGAWTWVKDTFTDVWNMIKTAVFDAWNAYVDQVQANWDMVTGALNTAWTWVKDTFTSVWESIKSLVFMAWETYVNNLKANWDTVTGALNTAWTWVKDTFSTVWNTIKAVVFDAFTDVVNGVKITFDTVTDGIAGAWDWLKDTLHAAWLWIDDNVFGAAKTALDTLQGWFQTAVDAVGNIWEGLQEAAAKPVRFVVDTVWNNGLLRAVNAVTGFIGMDEIKPVKIDFATGGVLPGYTPGRDPYTFVEPSTGMRIGLSGGEAILRPEATRALGTGWVNSVNAAAISGGQSGVENQLMRSHFADGGVLDLGNFNMGGITNLAGGLSDIQQSHARFVGRFFPDLFNLTSAMRFTDSGHHSTGKATDWQAKDGQFASQMPTPGSKALARAIFTNFPNSAELIHHPLDGWQNLSNGSPLDFGPGTNADHGNHVHWATHSPLQFNGDDIVLTDVPGGGGGGNFIKGIWDRIVNAINPYEDDDGGWFGQVPGNFLKSAVDKVWSFISEKAKSVFNFFTGGSGGGAEQWRDLARVALGRHGYGDEHLDAMVRQIEIESGGNPNAVNLWDSNARRGTPSGGLIQVIRPTYDRVRAAYPDAFEGLPNDHMEPLSNLTAGVGAVKLDWGGPANRWPTVDGYHEGGLAPAGQGILHKTALEPEMVLSPQMTDAFIDWMRGTPQGESASVVAKELASAFAGEDWGYGELAHVLGNEEWARAIVSGAATLGVISRDTDFIAANAELHETAESAGRGYLETQATGLLDTVGLGGLVSMGSSLWDQHGDQAIATAQSLYGATQNPDSTASVTAFGRTVHMEFNAESLDDVVRVGDIADAMNRLDGVEAKVNEKRRQPAANVTRGGVM